MNNPKNIENPFVRLYLSSHSSLSDKEARIAEEAWDAALVAAKEKIMELPYTNELKWNIVAQIMKVKSTKQRKINGT